MGCCGTKVYTTEVEFLPDANTPTTPQRVRRPRDVFFLLLYLAMLGGMGYLAYFGVENGDPARYLYGIDSWGNVCGRKENFAIPGAAHSGKDHSNRTFEFHMGLSDVKTALNPLNYLTGEGGLAVVCVTECPKHVISCDTFLANNGYELEATLVDERVCTMNYDIILPHSQLINRCIPSHFAQVGSALVDTVAQIAGPDLTNQTPPGGPNDSSTDDVVPAPGHVSGVRSSVTSCVQHVVTSVMTYWKDITYLILLAFGVSLLMIILMQIFTRVIVVVIIFVAGVGSVALTAYLWYNYAVAMGYIDDKDVANVVDSAIPFVNSLSQFAGDQANGTNPNISATNATNFLDSLAISSIRDSEYLLPATIIVSVIAVIVIILLIWVRKSLCLVVKLFDEASLAIFSMPAILFQPFVSLVAMLCVCGHFLVIGTYLFSVGDPVVDEDGMVGFIEKNSTPTLALIAPHIFGCLWMIEFISGCQQVILAGAICKWFFSRQSEKKGKCKCQLCPTLRPTMDLVLFNLGTVAFGSLIIAIVQFIRIVLGYLQRKLKGRESKAARNLLKCLGCCMACFEKVLKYINRNAYICAVMYGEGFCSSGKKAFTLLLNNVQHMMALNCVSGFCLFLGKFSAVVVTGFASVGWFKYTLGADVSSSEYFIPTTIACIVTYVFASCFFNVYGMAIDTIFLCFCDDQQRNNGDDRPYYSSVKLQQYMTGSFKNNKKRNKRPG